MKKIMIAATVLALVLALAGCQSTDVVAKFSVTSFEALLNTLGDKVAADDVNGGWALQSPGGERFVWSKDFSTDKKPDLMLELDATPFLNAGLDPTKLDKETYLYDDRMNFLMVHSELGADKFAYSGEVTPLDSFKQLVATHRDSIGYHETLDHYGAALGNGNMFEWAKDMATNDKDMVFVLNPQPLIDAGVDSAKVEAWVFAQVEVKNEQGQKELVDKFLKPYNLD